MRTRPLALAGLLLVGATARAADPPKPADRPLPPDAAAKAMTVPDGFKVTLFAGEPDVVQPIAMTFDTRGRLWVVECKSYPKWRADGTGSDRVVILEDTDGDGRHDKRTVFLDNGSNLSGIELGFGGVWLCSLPNLIFIPMKDGEDKPAGPPEILLDGWNLKDTKHNVFNSLGWGPDGWLYGCNGIQARSKVGKPGTPDKDRTYLDCGVWRYHPTRKTFEVYATGTTNPFGLDWDDHGQMVFTNCVIHHLWHVVPGGRYERMYGEDANPHAYALMKSCADHLHWGGGAWTSSRTTGVGGKPEHSEAGGGHAHSGCAVYLGDNFPAEYRNSVFMCNIHGNRLNRDRLERTPSGYVGKHAPDFLFANDAWFRGICVKTGPEGGLYVTDWSDTGECHNYEVADTTNGRIFRVVYGTPKPWRGDVAKLSDAELMKMLFHQNDWFARQARRVLQERYTTGKLADGTVKALRELVETTPDVTWKLRAARALHSVGGLSADVLRPLLGHEDDAVRAWAVALAADGADDQRAELVAAAAGKEESPFVLAAAAGVAPRLPAYAGQRLALAVVRRVTDTDDGNLALMAWYAAQADLAKTDRPPRWTDYLKAARHPLVARHVARYCVAGVPADKRADRLALLTRYMADDKLSASQLPVLLGIGDALSGVRELPEPAGWGELYASLAESDLPEVRTRAEALAVVFGNKKAVADLTARMNDPKADPAARVAAVELLTRRRPAGIVFNLHVLLADPAVRGAAVRALAAFPDDQTPSLLLAAYPRFTAAEKADAVQTLASRPKWAGKLLDAVQDGEVPRADVSLLAARQILALNDNALSAKLGQVWGKVSSASKERTTRIAAWKEKLNPTVMKAADPAAGRAVFAKSCATCHKLFGEGTDAAPDLTGSQRANLDYLLENVLDPSAVVPREYQVTNFSLADGRVVAGIVLRETPDGVTVRTTNEVLVLPAGDIEGRKPTGQSLMPEGLFDNLKPEEVRDLVAYLASPKQVPPK
ncbi:MAG: c-type cytochrome [Gemmataceae bacterium]|nr:c-type cytochrome [Gemmataceae bacterium]